MAKNKLAKFAEMETLENVFQPTHEEVFRTDYKLKGKWGEQVFGNDHRYLSDLYSDHCACGISDPKDDPQDQSQKRKEKFKINIRLRRNLSL